MKQLDIEVTQIVAYVEKSKTEHGEYPRDLSGYVFQWPSLQKHIHYTPLIEMGANIPTYPYQIRYHPIEIDDVTHVYSGDRGYWFDYY